MTTVLGQRSFRFAVGSGVGLLIDLGGFALLSALGVLTFAASLISTALAITTVYVLATRYAFRVGRTWRTYVAFVAWYAASALVVAAVVQLVGGADTALALVTKICTVPFTFVSNYLFGGWLFGGGAERLRTRLRRTPSDRPDRTDEEDGTDVVDRTDAVDRLLRRRPAQRARLLVSTAVTTAFVVLVLPMNLAVSFEVPDDRRAVLLANLLRIAFTGALFAATWFGVRFAQALRRRSVRHRRWIAVSATYLAVNLVLLVLIYPGYWVSDEYYTLDVVKQYSVAAWQGYLTAVYYTFGLSLGPSPIFILLVQLVAIALIVGYVLSVLMARLARPALAWLGLIPLLAFPVLLSNQYPLRLTLYGYLLLLLVVRIGVIAGRRRTDGPRPGQFVVLSLLIGVLAFWRSEGVFLLLLVPVCFVLTGMPRTIRLSRGRGLTALAAGLGIVGVIGGVTTATAIPGYQATALLNPLSTMLQGELHGPGLDRDLRTIDRTLDLDVVRRYPAWTETPSLAGALRNGPNGSITPMLPAFVDVVAHNPGPFLDNRVRAFLAANSMQTGWLPQVTPMQVFQRDANVSKQLQRFYSTNFLVRPLWPEVKYPVEQGMLLWSSTTGMLPVSQVVWNSLPQLAMTLLLGIAALARRRWWWAFSAAVVLGNASMVFLTEPAAYFMYFFPAYLVGGALFAGALIVTFDRVLARGRKTSSLPVPNWSPVSARPSVLLAIPAYNCAPQVGRVLGAVDERLLARLDQVVVIDNRSQDGTVAAAESAGRGLGEKFRVWRNVENFGLGGTHKVAFDAAVEQGFDYVAILHGDDQADAAELHRLLDRAEREPAAAAVLGARFLPRSRRIGYSRVRTAGNIAINAVFSVVAGRRTIDLGSGLNLFRVQDLADGRYRAFDDGITFNIDLLLHCFRTRARLAYEPITWREDDQVSNARNLTVGRTALRKLFRWRFGRRLPGTANRAYRFEVVA